MSNVHQVPDDPERLRDLLDHMADDAGLVGLRISIEHEIKPDGQIRTVFYMTHSLGHEAERSTLERVVPVMHTCHEQMLRRLEAEHPQSDASKVAAALEVARRFSQIGGEHHKAWAIDRMVRALTGNGYEAWIRETREGEEGPETYPWDEGVAP